MPLEFVAEFLFAFLDLVRMSLFAAVPAFFLVLAGQWLNVRLKKRFKLSWIASAFIACFAVLVPIVFALYLFPYSVGYFESSLTGQPVPDFMQLTWLDYAMAFILTVVRNLVSAVLFAVLLMPLVFLGAYFDEKLKQRFKLPVLANTFAAVFLTSAAAWLIVLFAFPWLVSAVFWKLYWSPI